MGGIYSTQLGQHSPKYLQIKMQEFCRNTLFLHKFGVIFSRQCKNQVVLCHLGGFLGWLLFLQYLNTVIPYEKKGSPPSVEDLQMLTNSEYSFKLLFRVSIMFWGHKNTFLFASLAAVWDIIAAQLVWGISSFTAAWAI